jgi:hypothetical protein
MKLSERISMGEDTPELHEAIAVLMGWCKTDMCRQDTWGGRYKTISWLQDGKEKYGAVSPNYLTDIRLTLAEIERRGFDFGIGGNEESVQVWIKHCPGAVRKDRDLARCACEVLVKALENDNG